MTTSTVYPATTIDVVVAKVLRRIIPFLFIAFVVAFLDRVNVGMAALTMNKDIGLTGTMFGWGAGLFFFGYFLFQVPSNLILYRLGASTWMACIMTTWGIIAAAMALVQGAYSFYALRFLLGLAESGFSTGVLLYLSLWIPERHRSKAFALFLVGAPVSSVIGSPISGALLSLNGVGNVAGWQWLFVLQGVPAIILGVLCCFILSDRPENATWLSAPEREELKAALDHETAIVKSTKNYSVYQVLTDYRIYVFAIINFFYLCGFYGLFFWLPQIIKGFGFSNFQVGLVNAIPFVLGTITMVLYAQHSDRTGERLWHAIIASCAAAAGLAGSALLSSQLLALVSICLGAMGIFAFMGVFFVVATSFLTGRGFAGGIGIIGSVGNIGGFAGPFVIGWTRDYTHSFTIAILMASASLMIPALMLTCMRSSAPSRRLVPAPEA